MKLLAIVGSILIAQGAFASGISISTDSVTGLPEPMQDSDAATKSYVDRLETELCALYELTASTKPDLCVRYVFISAQGFTGALVSEAAAIGSTGLSGVEAADALCQYAADNAINPLPGSYKAWIAIDNTDDPESRFTREGQPWVLFDHTLIANDWADLTDGILGMRIEQTEIGSNNTDSVWTNVNIDGAVTGSSHCNGWTSDQSGDFGTWGHADTHLAGWTEMGETKLCSDQPVHLYCFQQ